MEIHIDDKKRLNDLKSEFSQLYPFLKLEFFHHSHKVGSGSPKSDMITSNPVIGEIRSKHNEGNMVINGDLSVNMVEQEFERKYGIHAQVFRKSGNIWLETSATDDWSLNEQNVMGREMSEV